MQKTRLGISAGMLAAGIYLAGLFSGYLVAVLLAGYVLLFEENRWLKISAVKAVCLMVFFSFLTTVINLIPDFLNVIVNFMGIFQVSVSLNPVTSIFYVVLEIVDIVEKILFLALGCKALSQSTIVIPFIDRFINKYMTMN